MPDAHQLRPAIDPTETRAGLRTTLGVSLPADILESAVRRLAWVGLLYAVTFALIHLMYRSAAQAKMLPAHQWTTAAAILLGALIAGLAWSRRVPSQTMLDMGLIFQVLAALLISLGETANPLPYGEVVRGSSAIATWIVLFVLVVPATLGKAALAAFVTACMGPVGLGINLVLHGYPRPQPEQWVFLYAISFLMVAASVVLSRYVYKLGVTNRGPRDIGSYQLLELIGRGGMGEVWRARHRLLVREAAIKVIRPEALLTDSNEDVVSVRRRFEREARATAALHSPSTVAVHDYGIAEDGAFYYVMELLQGVDLETYMERFGPMREERIIYILGQVCDSLAEAHAAGMTHRDVKPRNVFLCRRGVNYDCVKVLDFGLVKLRSSGDQSKLTREGITAGTPAYMSPEMAMGHRNVDARSDLYALGCVAYFLLTGQLVFDAPNALSMALDHVQTEPIPPSARTEIEVNPHLDRLVLQCLAKKPEHRPQSARELKRLLEAIPLSEPWHNDRAEEWWQAHLPAALHLHVEATG